MTPWLDDGDVRLYHGDALQVLSGLPDESVDCVVTSPPYWGLRSYLPDGHDDKPSELGLEPTPDEFVAAIVAVFREVRRVLAPHGTCWVNLGDSYAGSWGNQGRKDERGTQRPINGPILQQLDGRYPQKESNTGAVPAGLKPKDLVGIPWRVAFALQADGWYLRSDIVWAKPNPMPESVTDRPTKSHEYVFMLTKRPRYWFDQEAVREPSDHPHLAGKTQKVSYHDESALRNDGDSVAIRTANRNVRSVWTIATQPYPEAHFATFPEELARRCILAGCPLRVCRVCGKPSERIVDAERWRTREIDGHVVNASEYARSGRPLRGPSDAEPRKGNFAVQFDTIGWSDCGHNQWRPGLVLDPFIGSGTVAKVARDHGRHAIGIDLNEQYLELAARRLQQLSLLTEAHP